MGCQADFKLHSYCLGVIIFERKKIFIEFTPLSNWVFEFSLNTFQAHWE